MIGTDVFRGTLPRVSARVLGPEYGQAAKECWLASGTVRPVPALVEVVGGLPAGTRTIFRFSPTQWFAWTSDVDAIRSPVAKDTVRRTMWTGDGFPRMTTTTIMGIFAGPGKPTSRRLGIPAPEDAPTVAAQAQMDVDADAAHEFHSYVYTYVSDLGEEGPPSPPSATVERSFDTGGAIQQVNLTNLTAGPSGPYGITVKRIYRTLVGTDATTFNLLAEIPVAQASYEDTKLTADLGARIVSTLWDPPPDDLEGLTNMGNGIAVGFRGRDVYFSEPYQPHAWPGDYIQTVGADIVGLGVFGSTVVVGTKGDSWIGSGSHPSNVKLDRMELDQACVSKRSFATIGKMGVVFASPDGLVRVGPGGGEIISRREYSLKEWRALGPGTLRSVYHDNQYLGFLSGRAVAFHPDAGGVTDFADNVDAVYVGRENDTVYVAQGGAIREFRTVRASAEALRTFTWRGRLETGPLRGYSAAQVIADDYPVTLKVYADDSAAPKHTSMVMNDKPFRLDIRNRHGNWEVEIEGENEVREFRVGDMSDMLGSGS